MDPLWGVLSSPERSFNRWDVDEFFRTGAEDVAHLMEAAEQLGLPRRRNAALDFGCGVGRLTRALAAHFERSHGVDTSDEMIRRARELNAEAPGCEFVVNHHHDLRLFPDAQFDLVYSRIVLQHLPNRRVIKTYIAEFVRTLRGDGLLVFQVLTRIPLTRRVQPRHRAYAALRAVGMPKELLYGRLRLMPYGVTYVPHDEVTLLLARLGARVLRAEPEHLPHSGIDSHTFYVARP